MKVTIVDYNSGNISSVINSFKEVAKDKVNIEVTADLNKIILNFYFDQSNLAINFSSFSITEVKTEPSKQNSIVLRFHIMFCLHYCVASRIRYEL